jgi:hypothetical protein
MKKPAAASELFCRNFLLLFCFGMANRLDMLNNECKEIL